ncbi:D-alanine--poly(phosphoribitol) ligase subunit 1 [Anoxybacillus tepidamans]|uniref:D-alanine--D-alanyl carrier protein ligase n=1 Tax=Anoxybacteroides tepidamans TaxID=265948 RepID=A0A7W8IT81_9BACL|nr:D-alanine--poly(phosphoribitol) ligase subunit DltA [Anoxybacillus tepidamans]MBB5326177.1 D-alanine--poly(phosphoribitol) ligase subunit 1 [Anoxybacillus tepidamans]
MELYTQIKKWAQLKPDCVAIFSDGHYLTYREIEEYSNALSVFISEKMKGSDSPVIVYGHMEPLMIVCFLASVKSGHAYIPIDASIPEERVKKIIDDSGAKLFLSPSSVPASLKWQDQLFIMDNAEIEDTIALYRGAETSGDKFVKGEQNFYIIYTSGSTGNPKGVQITYNNLASFVEWMVSDFRLKEHQRFLNQAPFSFDLSVMDLYPCLYLGGTLWTISKDLIANPKWLFQSLKESNIHVWTSTPSFVEMCLMDQQFSAEMLPHLETFLFCGEMLPNETARKLKARFPHAVIYNTYGPTETTVAVTSIEINEEILNEYPSLPVGTPKKDVEIFVVDENGNEVNEGEKGEIIITGKSVSKGYLHNEELTKKSFFLYHNQPAYKTGDVGYMKNGLLFCAGRLDFQIKLNGYRMELEEIEAQLRKLSLVESAVVVPIYKESKCQYLMAVVVPKKHDFEKEYQLTAYLKKELQQLLPAYMIPKKFVYVSSLPMTNNGKADRKKIANEVGV